MDRFQKSKYCIVWIVFLDPNDLVKEFFVEVSDEGNEVF